MLGLASPEALAADLILQNARIYTAAANGPSWAQAIAITDGRIDRVGSAADVLRLKTKATRVVDLQGKMVIPGMIDGHTHLWFGAQVHDGFNLIDTQSSITPLDGERYVAAVRSYAQAHPEKVAIFGRSDFNMYRPSTTVFRTLLDQAERERPLIIHHVTEHAYIVNSKALALAGITDKPLPDPLEEKYVVRDSAGHPTGLIQEGAMQAIERSMPRPPMAEQERLMASGLGYLNSFGVTSALATTGGRPDLEIFSALHRRGALTVRVRQAFASLAVNHRLTGPFLAELEDARAQYRDAWVSANAVKFFMDGVNTDLFYKQEDYIALVKELDRRGFIVLTHAFSAEALGSVLDSYEAVEKANGPRRDRLFRIEHAVVVPDVRLRQFGRLGLAVSMQAMFCCGPPILNQWNSLLKSGVALSFSSDWPCTWPPNPMLAIREAALRYQRRPLTPNGPVGPLVSDDHPEERLTVEQALLAYTRVAAEASGWKDRGTLEAGKLADLVVLSQNILEVPPETIADTVVLTTMVDGKVVYGDLR